MPEVCRTLQRANESRRRAWRELQRLRKVMASEIEIPPAPKPPDFAAEGELLRTALRHLIARQERRLRNLIAALEAMRPYMSASLAKPGDTMFHQRHQDLNSAIQEALYPK